MQYLAGHQEEEAVAWMMEAARAAKKALCLATKCGTVIVKDGAIIGEGYNGPPLDNTEGRICGNETGPSNCVHSEWRAIFDALRNNPEKIKGSKLYFIRVDEAGATKRAGNPTCTVCSRMALDVGIDKFLLWHKEGISEYDTDEYNRLSYEHRP